MKGSRNLSFQCVKKPKLANRCILWLWKSQKSVLFLCVVYSYFNQVYETVGISLVEIYERVEKSVVSVCKKA